MDFTIWNSDSGRGNRFICSSEVCTISVAHRASCSVGNGGLVTGVKRPGRETDYLPRSRAEVKNEWSYTSTMPVYIHCIRRNITLLPFKLRKLVNNSIHKPLIGSRCWPSYRMTWLILIINFYFIFFIINLFPSGIWQLWRFQLCTEQYWKYTPKQMTTCCFGSYW